MKTHNGANMKYSTGNPLVEFFSKAGSAFEKKASYYSNEASALDLFYNAWAVNKEKAFKLLLWCRDIRGGAGNRSGSRSILNWIANNEPEWVSLNIEAIPQYGRWDDLMCLMVTPLEDQALTLWTDAILSGNGLAAKWAPRENKSNSHVAKKLRKTLKLSSKEYRKLLVRNTNVVEHAMCSQNWEEINFSHVPSVAMSRYNKSFWKHEAERFSKYLEDIKNPDSKEKINSGAIYPHDLIRQLKNGYRLDFTNTEVVDAQFSAMPNFFETGLRVMPIVDTSGSMGCQVSGSITAMDIALSLAFYTSDRVGSDNPFYRKFIPFSSNSRFFDWNNNETFSEGLSTFMKSSIFGWVGSTNIASAFRLLLDTASFLNVTSDQMPNTILIISDMQFNKGTSGNKPEVEALLDEWKSRGYDIPNIVYWNTSSYAGSPADVYSSNTGLVSGFSPSILNAVFKGVDFSPMGIMEQAIADYEVIVPK